MSKGAAVVSGGVKGAITVSLMVAAGAGKIIPNSRASFSSWACCLLRATWAAITLCLSAIRVHLAQLQSLHLQYLNKFTSLSNNVNIVEASGYVLNWIHFRKLPVSDRLRRYTDTSNTLRKRFKKVLCFCKQNN